jgi:putative restriction endonuclease
MEFDYDLRLRLAVFEHVTRLQREGGGVITWRQLNQGLLFEGQRVPIWNQQKGIFRPAVLRESGAALSIQTSFDGPYDDASHDDDRFVYKYRGTDPDHPDNRALREAKRQRRPLLYLVAERPGVYRPIFPCLVVGEVTEQLSFLLVADALGSITAPAAELDDASPLKSYITREVKQRLHQGRFRWLVLTAYAKQCAMCMLRHTDLLDAAHIIEDRDVRGLPEVPNGLSLCRIHHAAYDAHILGVDASHAIHVRRDVLEEIDGPMLRHGLQDLQGERLHVPRRLTDRPNPDYLAERFDRFRAA